MGPNIGTAYIRVAPNMTGIQSRIASGLRGTGTQFANQMGGEISARAAAIAGAIAGVASAAVNKAISLVSNSVGDAVSRVDTLARFPTVMKNLGYSADDAASQIQRIAKNLIGLPTSLDSLTTFVQRVAPVSGSLQRATDVALAFNNAVLAGGGPVYRQADAIEQFSQMLAKGEPDLMAWRTLQEAMPATLGQIAKQLGVTSGNTGELYDKMKDGAISFDDFTNAVLKLDKEGLPGFKNFADQAKDATGGIQTGWQNMQTAITRGVAKIITAVGQENISNAIASIGKGFETALTTIATYVPPTLDAIGKVFDFIGRNKDILGPLAAGVLAVVAAWKIWRTTIAIATAAQAAFNVVMSANPIGLIIIAIVGIITALTLFFTKTETGKKVLAAFGAFIGKVWEGIKTGLQAVGDFFGKVWGAIETIVSTVFGAIANFWNTKLKPVFDVMIQIVTTILGIYIKVWAFIALVIVGTMAIIFQTIWSVMQKIWGVIQTIWNAVWGVISAVIGWIWDRIVTAFNFYLSIITTVLNAIWGVISSVWNAIWGFISPILTTIGNFISNTFNGIKNTLTGVWNSIFNTISGAVGRIWDAVTSAFNRVTSFVGGIGGKILGALGNLGSTLYNSGRDLIQGLLNGAGSLLSKIANFFLDKLPGWIQGPFKKALGIASPSKVFAGYGENIGEGVIKGVDRTASAVRGAVSGMASEAIAGMARVDDAMASGFNSTTPISASIRGGEYEAAPKVVQHNNFTVKEQMDVNKIASDLGYAVAMA